MALFIRDPEVDDLAEEVRKLTKVKTKTEAVRRALQTQISALRRALPLRVRLARSKALADAIGGSASDFDMKAYTDEMWGEILMFVDASVIVAILGREPGHEEIEKRMAESEGPFIISPLVRFEASISLARQKAMAKAANAKPTAALLHQARAAVDAFIEDVGAEEIAISPDVGQLALDACATYGKAVGHIADLNFGDCFAYACAKARGVALLYKGSDFVHTDLA